MVSSSRRSTAGRGGRRGEGLPREVSTVRQPTHEQTSGEEAEEPAQPGLLLIFSGGQPQWSVLRLAQPDGALELGRDNVNCATIPESIAERLLFGAKRGAFSGAVSDSEGYLQSAHQGTLFLDEIAELQAPVQAKLLRVLETREVLPVGAVRPQAIKLRVVSASHRSLQAEVAAGRLREDLYYRIGRPAEHVPPLRERPEEIPWLIAEELQRQGSRLSPHVSLIEACVLRHFPGNVRELLIEVRSALHEASLHDSGQLRSEHLAETAGQPRERAPELAPVAAAPASSPAVPRAPEPTPPATRPSQAALVAANLNQAEAARRLQLHRTQLRRYIAYYGIDLAKLRDALP